MKFLEDTNWETILHSWKENEEGFWEHIYTKQGQNWEQWREKLLLFLEQQKGWKTYQVGFDEVLEWQCGAFPQWLNIAKEVGSRKFQDIAKAQIFQNYEKLEAIKKDFPKEVEFIGIRYNNEIYILEGNHRCTALSQMLASGIKPDTSILLVLSEITKDDHVFVNSSK